MEAAARATRRERLRRAAVAAACTAALLGCSVRPAVPADVVDAAAPPTDGGTDAPARISPDSFRCNLVIGVSVTGDWFMGGFEAEVDRARWEARTQHRAFIDLWDDPANAVWSIPLYAPCASGADSPDRVLFMGVNWNYTTVDEWVHAYVTLVDVLRMKYPALREVDLLTMLRAPGNVSCGNSESTVAPFIDQAIERVAAMYPGFVYPAPRFEAPSCDVFMTGGPHFTAAGIAAVAHVYGSYYAREGR